MAKNVKDDGGDNVVPMKRGRGRPKGSTKKTTPGLTVHTGDGNVTKAAAKAAETAPAFGHNRADESLFLRHVRDIRTQLGVIDNVKSLMKTEKGKLKDIRTLAKSEGIVMRELDEAIEALETEHVDLIAREQRRRLYFQWLGLPIEQQTQAFNRDEAGFWHNRGSIAGRLGEDRKVPDGVPPDRVQDWLKGWEAGQEALMRESPLTKGAFAKPGEHTGAAPAAGNGETSDAPRAAGGIFILKEDHFATDTGLEDASKATLLRDHLEAWEAAERVVAVFQGKRRILKEPGFEDTGEPNSETSDAEPLPDAENPVADLVEDAAEDATAQAEGELEGEGGEEGEPEGGEPAADEGGVPADGTVTDAEFE